MSNKSNGNKSEATFARMLSKDGYWVHRLVDRVNGQPFDIIAIKDNFPLAVDCKDCENGRFEFRRVEPNQETAMKLWQKCNNTNVGFALRAPTGTWYYLSYNNFLTLRRNGTKSVDISECHRIGDENE